MRDVEQQLDARFGPVDMLATWPAAAAEPVAQLRGRYNEIGIDHDRVLWDQAVPQICPVRTAIFSQLIHFPPAGRIGRMRVRPGRPAAARRAAPGSRLPAPGSRLPGLNCRTDRGACQVAGPCRLRLNVLCYAINTPTLEET